MSTSDSNDKAGEARRGLFDAVAGKAKEVAGALTGKDELTQEGQLQQADAQARRDANSREAIADASTRQTVEELREQKQDATEDKHEAYAEAGARENAVVASAEVERKNAEAQARVQEQADRTRAEQQGAVVAREGAADAIRLQTEATSTERQAEQEQARLERDASEAELQAARLRADAGTN
jgi:uncharacterized protein YjbJ (UPF0337 family)